MNKLGAVVVAYNSSLQLPQCLISLRRNNVAPIVVVDNSNDAATKDACRAVDTTYLPQAHNLGFATAVNIGARELTCDYLLCINPDASLPPHAASISLNYLDQNPKIGIVGLLLCSLGGQPEHKSFGPRVTPVALVSRQLFSAPIPKNPCLVGWVSGGAMIIRRQTFLELGGFDPGFFMYWEDVDICRRAQDKGWQVALLPNVAVPHSRGSSHDKLTQKTALYDASADRYFHKHYAHMIWFLQRFLRQRYRRFWRPQSY